MIATRHRPNTRMVGRRAWPSSPARRIRFFSNALSSRDQQWARSLHPRGTVTNMAGHAGPGRRMPPVSLTGGVVSIGWMMLLVAASPGCSFVFTRGPEATVSPARSGELFGTTSPDCTSSVAAPVVDTVLATLSLALIGAAVIAVANCKGSGSPAQSAGAIAIAGGAATGAVFTASAVAGYQRTAACRAALESRTLLPQPRASLLPSSPLDGCGPAGDAPLCRSVAAWPRGKDSGPSASSVNAR
jgi:hypothetical protein